MALTATFTCGRASVRRNCADHLRGEFMNGTEKENITLLMAQAADSIPQAAEKLLPLVYEQLKVMARQRMANERRDHTLQPTALVHEAYMKLVGASDIPWGGRAQFFFAAAQAMRRILVDHARSRGNLKRGGGRMRMPSNIIDLAGSEQANEILALDEALSRLERDSPEVGKVVRLRFFGGLSIDETADALGVSPRTVKRDWTFARAWLNRELSGDEFER